MATTDIRFKRIQGEYRTLQDAQDELFDKVDSFEAALLGLTEMVAENREMILENSRKLDAIIEHLQVPYNKPPAGFVKE
ncbi:MAG: hypothetical protein OXG53_18785 [Chloroflexi bacterium]|nr:hypothetical protein [Chloroflexota bacterium]